MAKYSKAAQKDVESAMKKMEKGQLRSGKSGKKVTNPKQAIAIGLSEAREKGAKVPTKKTAFVKPAKKTAVKAVKKVAAKSAIKKTAAAKKSKKAMPGKAEPKNKSLSKEKILPIENNDLQESKITMLPTQPEEHNDNFPPVEEKSPEVLPINEKEEDPATAIDKRALAKAVSKSDPMHPMHISNVKRGIRPSGKKPLWR